MIFVQTASSITHQDSFQKESIWETLKPLDENSEIISPEYKNYIPPAALRRLSPVLRMALTAAQECQSKVATEFDAISVGTALGCLKDTEKFLNTFITTTGDTLSPTAFIQSTHNTIGGQISLALGNHAYNMTHTQNSVSFEVALIDAMMCVKDGKKSVLVGAADEAIDFLELLRGELIESNRQFTSGASFFVIGNTPTNINVKDCVVHFNSKDAHPHIADFLTKNSIDIAAIDLVLHTGIEFSSSPRKEINYQDYSGLYFSSSAFAFHMAHDFLISTKANSALIINAQTSDKLGLIFLKRA